MKNYHIKELINKFLGKPSVVTVTEGGEVKAVSPGTAVITATETGSGYKAACL